LLGYYVLIVLGIALFQRHLIYRPTRVALIPAQAAGFAPDAIHDVVLTTDDGLELHGWHLLPTGKRCHDSASCDAELQAAQRVVLYFPANMGNRSDRAAECASFTALDAHVLLFDYRGYGENPGTPGEEALARDAHAVWNYAINVRGLAPERIILFGESLGGGVATRLAAELCDARTPPAGLILSGTFSSLADTGANLYPWLPVRLLLVDCFPSESRMAKVSCPVLQFHGDRDEIVPFQLGSRLFEAVPARSSSGIARQFVKVVGGGHNDFPEPTFREPIREFFETVKNR